MLPWKSFSEGCQLHRLLLLLRQQLQWLQLLLRALHLLEDLPILPAVGHQQLQRYLQQQRQPLPLQQQVAQEQLWLPLSMPRLGVPRSRIRRSSGQLPFSAKRLLSAIGPWRALGPSLTS